MIKKIGLGVVGAGVIFFVLGRFTDSMPIFVIGIVAIVIGIALSVIGGMTAPAEPEALPQDDLGAELLHPEASADKLDMRRDAILNEIKEFKNDVESNLGDAACTDYCKECDALYAAYKRSELSRSEAIAEFESGFASVMRKYKGMIYENALSDEIAAGEEE